MQIEEPENYDAHVYDWSRLQEAREDEFARRQQSRMRPEPPTAEEAAVHEREEASRIRRWTRRRRLEALDEEILKHEELFFQSVAHAKPYADYIALLTTHTLLSGLFFALGGLMLKAGWSYRSAVVMFFLFVYWCRMIGSLDRVNMHLLDMCILMLVRRLRLPNPPDIKWLTFKLLWTTTYAILQVALLMGTSFVGYDLTSRIIEQVVKLPVSSLPPMP